MLEKDIKDRSVSSVTLHYDISNNGDGSASLVVFKTPEEASQYDENMDEGWGESCDGTKELHFDEYGVLINADVLEEDEED